MISSASSMNSLNAYSIYSDYKFYNDYLFPKNTQQKAYYSNSRGLEFWSTNLAGGTNMLTSLTTFKSGATSFKNSVSALTSSRMGSVFNLKTPVSSNDDAVSVKLDAKSNASLFKAADVKVSQIALAQKNESKSLSSTAKSAASGEYKFSLDMNGKAHTFTINVTEKDTNQSVLQKMADIVNAKNPGVKAVVVDNAADKTSKLQIEAKATGAKDAVFTLSDVSSPSGSGGLVALTGADNIAQQAQNALYTINGKEKTQASNEIDLGYGVKATLKKATESSVRISVGVDAAAVKKGVTDFVESYNSLAINSLENGFSKIGYSLISLAKSNSRALSAVGIEVGSSGALLIDSEKLDKAIVDGSAKRLFQSRGNYGFASKLESAASAFAGNPMRYSDLGAQLQLYSKQNSLENMYNAMYGAMFSGQLFNYMI